MDREAIKNRFNGRCAYCGSVLPKRWHIDHIRPIYRNRKDKPTKSGDCHDSNMVPACPQCNLRKGVLSVDEFKEELKRDIIQLRRDSAKFRLLEKYGMLKIDDHEITFYIETIKDLED